MTDADPAATAVDEETPAVPPDDRSDAPPERSARDRTLVRSLAVLAGVFLLGALVLAIVAANVYNELQHERNDRDDVQHAASTFAGRLLTFDYRKLDDLKNSVDSMSTARFRREYARAFPSLSELIKAGQTVSRGDVTDIYVGSVDTNSANVIAVVKTATNGRAGRRSGDFYMELDMAKNGSRWLIDGFTNLNFAQGAGAGTAPSPTTTTP